MRYGPIQVLHSVSLTLSRGEFVAVGGPNGAGKSTLLSIMAGLVTATEGSCCFLNRDVRHWPRRDFARRVAVVTQSEHSAFPFTAGEVVAMGRMPHADGFLESDTDRTSIRKAMLQTDVEQFRDRDFRTLSAGEKQRVFLASALAQEPEVLLLDEPSSHLDLHHQLALHVLLQELKQSGILVVVITHELNLAAMYADRLILIHEGQIKADDKPSRVLTPALMREIFHVHAGIGQSVLGTPWISYGPLNG